MDLVKILKIKTAFDNGELGSQVMPEDTYPEFKSNEDKLLYYTLPMALNYQRNSYKLWEAAKATYEDIQTYQVFSMKEIDEMKLREMLTKNKLALQPNNHIKIWQTISNTIQENWQTLENFFQHHDNDFLAVKQTVQKDFKKGFPYLSGPKIFNYWAYIMEQYCAILWKNREYIEIAPDTHVIQASIRLGVITKKESEKMTRESISKIWRNLLKETNISPIDMHSPLWFWSKSGFKEI